MSTKQILLNFFFIPDIPFKADLYSSNPDKIKHAEFSILACLFLASKKNISPEELRQSLIAIELKKDTVDELVTIFSLNKEELYAKSMSFAPSIIPHITNVKWSLLCDVDSTGVRKAGELTYKIQLNGVVPSIQRDISTDLTFLCSPEELQALVNRFKEIERHCYKIASNK